MADGKPTCGVVIRRDRNTGQETVCPNEASDLVTVVNPDNTSQVQALLLVCKQHSRDVDDGKSLIFLADDGEHIAVQFPKGSILQGKEENNTR